MSMVEIIKDKEEVKSVMNIIQAFADGKTIQAIDPYDDEWCNQTKLNFKALFEGQYRIKPDSKAKAKYRPFANVEECWQEMLKHQPFGWVKNNNLYRNILETSDGAILLPSFPGEMFVFSFNKAKEKFTFADGTPFGVKVEE